MKHKIGETFSVTINGETKEFSRNYIEYSTICSSSDLCIDVKLTTDKKIFILSTDEVLLMYNVGIHLPFEKRTSIDRLDEVEMKFYTEFGNVEMQLLNRIKSMPIMCQSKRMLGNDNFYEIVYGKITTDNLLHREQLRVSKREDFIEYRVEVIMSVLKYID